MIHSLKLPAGVLRALPPAAAILAMPLIPALMPAALAQAPTYHLLTGCSGGGGQVASTDGRVVESGSLGVNMPLKEPCHMIGFSAT